MPPKFVIDDREKKPYQFSEPVTTTERLDVGDYTVEGFEDIFAVERKTLDDLARSVGAERVRFENEIRRANGYADRNENDNPLPGTKPDAPLQEFAVVIEAPSEHVYKYRNSSGSPKYYSNIHPNSIIGTTEQWPEKYDVLDFYWCGNRRKAKLKTETLLNKWYLRYS